MMNIYDFLKALGKLDRATEISNVKIEDSSYYKGDHYQFCIEESMTDSSTVGEIIDFLETKVVGRELWKGYNMGYHSDLFYGYDSYGNPVKGIMVTEKGFSIETSKYYW